MTACVIISARFRTDDEQKVSIRKAYEMTCAVNQGLEQQRQQ